MNTNDHRPQWSTSSFGCAADTSPAELSTLQAHAERCHRARSRWFSVQCATEGMKGLIAGRFVTTVMILSVAVLLLVVIASWALR